MPLLAWYGYSIQLLAGEVHGCIHERGCWPTLPPCHRHELIGCNELFVSTLPLWHDGGVHIRCREIIADDPKHQFHTATEYILTVLRSVPFPIITVDDVCQACLDLGWLWRRGSPEERAHADSMLSKIFYTLQDMAADILFFVLRSFLCDPFCMCFLSMLFLFSPPSCALPGSACWHCTEREWPAPLREASSRQHTIGHH